MINNNYFYITSTYEKMEAQIIIVRQKILSKLTLLSVCTELSVINIKKSKFSYTRTVWQH